MAKRESPPRDPAKTWRHRLWPEVRKRLLSLAVLLALKVLWFSCAKQDAHKLVSDGEKNDLLTRRAYLVRRVCDPQFGPGAFPKALGDPFRGEWAIVTMSMTAVALTNLAFIYPETRPESLTILDKMIERTLHAEFREFDRSMWESDPLDTLQRDEGHVGYLGHLNMMLALRESLLPESPHHELLVSVTQALTRKIERGTCGAAETYPLQLFLPDNAVALASIALAERVRAEPERGKARALLDELRTRYTDHATGLLSFGIAPGCKPSEGARSSGAAWNGFFFEWVDSAYARENYRTIKAHFLDTPFPGIVGLRERPRGDPRGGDVDSGPLLLGLSPSGTGFAIASAKISGDVNVLQGFLDTSEIAGFTWQWRGERRYLTAPVVADAILLAMKTARPLDALP